MSLIKRFVSSTIGRVLLAGMLAFVVLIGVVVWQSWQAINLTADYSVSPVDVSIKRGQSFNAIVKQLETRELITHGLALRVYARLTGKAAMVKAGEFRLDEELSAIQMLDLFISGRVRQHQLVIVEGWSFKQLRAAIESADNVLDVKSREMTAEELMTAIGYPDVHPEGRFMPDTYSFPLGTSDIDFLRRAYDTMQTYLDRVWPDREEGLPIETPYDALILASIVEKETAAPAERPEIAGVFLSRLNKKMCLQTDPTVIYGVGDAFDGNIRRKDLRTDTPYNTYTRHGLTPTPIAMPGRAAIDAVLHPAETKALYFVSRGDGTHKFSQTLQEHEAAVDKYQRKRSSN